MHPSSRLPFGSPAHPSMIPVVPTPFGADESVDTNGLGALVHFAASTGVEAICLPAYGSEFYKLSDHERDIVVETAVHASNGTVPVIAQCNHGSARVAAESARSHEGRGADAIAVALPRQFTLAEDDLLRYAIRIATAVSIPIVIQDFNPGGAAVGADFARRLKDAAPNFVYLKLEEPLMSGKIVAIREATHDGVGVLEGWGGMHLLELLPVGISGVMPGLGVCDHLRRIIRLAQDGMTSAAREGFQRLLPYITYSLQNMEVFHHCEKRLLSARGLLASVEVRSARRELAPAEVAHIESLIADIVALP